MKLSELVKLKQKLLSVSVGDLRYQLDMIDGRVASLLDMHMHADYMEDVNGLINKLDNIQNILDNFENVVPTIISKLDTEIAELTKEFHRRGYVINGLVACDAANKELERAMRSYAMTSTTRSEIIVRLRSYTDWHYPALEIGPGDGIWTDHLVAADPLYLIDVDPEYLQNTLGKFNEVYQKRIRPYVTGAWVGKSDFDYGILPKNQFSFIFAWNVFDYFPMYETELALTQCFELLRPGGTMMFSYNNCEIPKSAEFAEEGVKSWMPKAQLLDLCRHLGFAITHAEDVEETVSWVEIKKPGELKTVKAHQVLGKIVTIKT